MKKKLWLWILLAAVVLLAAAGGTAAVILTRNSNEAQAEAAHAAIHEQYLHLRRQAEDSALTVTEGGEAVGTYSLEQLGLLQDVLTAVDGLYSNTDRLAPEDFALLTYAEKTAWNETAHPDSPSLSVAADNLDSNAVLEDLNSVDRHPSRDASVRYDGGAYAIEPEAYGTELQTDDLLRALRDCAGAMTLTPDTAAEAALEVSDFYILPQVTEAENDFDYAEILASDIDDVTITLDFHGSTETLAAKELLSVDESGNVQIDQQALTQQISAWAQTYQAHNTNYIFDSYADGPVAIDFIYCSYDVDAAALESLLTEQLLTLESAALEAPYLCVRYGQPFAIEGTYIEIDITNQTMTYFKDGVLMTTTPVVTGRPNGRETPNGLYGVENTGTDMWLVGADYAVFVRWWIGVYGNYGIHDASWRDQFGGELYLYGGSHGCINTPDEPTEIIFNNVDIGTPVLIYEH